MECRLQSFIYYKHKAQDFVLPQKHQAYEIILYEKGSGTTTIDNELYEFSNMDLAIITPETMHDEITNKDSIVYCCVFEYEDEFFKLENGILKEKQPETAEILSLMYQMKEEMQNKKRKYEQYMDALMMQILILISRMVDSKIRTSDGTIYAKQYLRENYGRKINFEVISKTIGYSYDRFRHLFTQTVGMSPHKYLCNIRVLNAKQLLKTTNLSVMEIGKICGFKSNSRFINLFTEAVGISPLKYRKFISTNSDEDLTNFNKNGSV